MKGASETVKIAGLSGPKTVIYDTLFSKRRWKHGRIEFTWRVFTWRVASLSILSREGNIFCNPGWSCREDLRILPAHHR
jgi:hypothetical protein